MNSLKNRYYPLLSVLTYHKYLYTAIIKRNFKYCKASCRILKYFTTPVSKVVKEIRALSQICLAFKIQFSHVFFREVYQRPGNQRPCFCRSVTSQVPCVSVPLILYLYLSKEN